MSHTSLASHIPHISMQRDVVVLTIVVVSSIELAALIVMFLMRFRWTHRVTTHVSCEIATSQ